MSSWPARSDADRWSTIEAAHDELGDGLVCVEDAPDVDDAVDGVPGGGVGAVAPPVGGAGAVALGDDVGEALGGAEEQPATTRLSATTSAPARASGVRCGRPALPRVDITS
jgi:hypothetical protein